MLQVAEAQGPYYKQEWEGMIQTTPIISGGVNALSLPAFFENLGHSIHSTNICTHDFAHLEHITYESCMHVLVWLRTYVQEKSALRQEVVQVQLSYSLSRWRFENRKHT